MRVICFGPGPIFKGGISNYNTSLAKALDKYKEIEVYIVSWTNQYPSIVPREFVDNSSKSDLLEGTRIKVHYITNYNRPSSWRATADLMVSLEPEIVIFQWAIAIQGLPMANISRRLKRKSPTTEIVYDLHFVVQKEYSNIDRMLTKRGIRHANTYITHAYKTVDELKELLPQLKFEVCEDGHRTNNPERRTVIKLFHPVYDLFLPDPNFDVQAFKAEHKLNKTVFLFFGFIRKYKGLHHAIRAFAKVAQKNKDVSFLICGESFWNTLAQDKWSTKIKNVLFGLAKRLFLKQKDNERYYQPLDLIKELGLESRIMVVNEFIPNEDVHRYFQVSDAVVLFYEYATPSGIESLSYNFKKPLLATKVGHFPETIEDGFNGYLAEAENIDSMAEQMLRFLDNPLNPENVASKTELMSWANYAKAILADR